MPPSVLLSLLIRPWLACQAGAFEGSSPFGSDEEVARLARKLPDDGVLEPKHKTNHVLSRTTIRNKVAVLDECEQFLTPRVWGLQIILGNAIFYV
ncbi:hypothetical protein Maq22A_c06615 [Methylobacterium aquaticum]|uniref:Uncharacterized protein n=1 Tax=Methylobacterium aquaticum TaxID=270351 RepID=A0A0C6FHU6_9HYPH|nr:hypothetical protein Maq22A_c06615 [Methylobacterium aquaticum]